MAAVAPPNAPAPSRPSAAARAVRATLRPLRWLAVAVPVAAAVFLAGEQVEIGRLGAIAACEHKRDPANCMRQHGYLAIAPFYPDIARRFLGGFARTLGGWMGASYAPPPPPDADEDVAE